MAEGSSVKAKATGQVEREEACRAEVRRYLRNSEGLSARTRVSEAYWLAHSLLRSATGEAARGAARQMLAVELLNVLPIGKVTQGLESICVERDGFPSRHAETLDIDWDATYADADPNDAKWDTPARRIEQNRQKARVAIEAFLHEHRDARQREQLASLRPLDLSRPPSRGLYDVEGVLVSGQPGVIGGPIKGLKTGLTLDLAVSLATKTPFLGRFGTHTQRRVAVFSGESGPDTLHVTLDNVCRAREVPVPGPEWLRVNAALPTLGLLADYLEQWPAEVVVLDPLYLLLNGEQATNLFVMGDQLAAVSRVCLEAGATPVLVHHFTENVQPGAVPDLAHLSFAGIKQFARQWVLINRRRKYRPDRPNHHRLWMVTGGSAGHGGLYGVTAEEGAGKDRWEVTVQSAAEARTDDEAWGDEVKTDRLPPAAARAAAVEARAKHLTDALDERAPNVGDVATIRTLRGNKMGQGPAEEAAELLVDRGIVAWEGADKKKVRRLRLSRAGA